LFGYFRKLLRLENDYTLNTSANQVLMLAKGNKYQDFNFYEV